MTCTALNALVPCEKLEEDSYDWYERHAAKCAEARSGNHNLVLIGDSITHFWETTLAPENYRATFAGINVMNLGYGWDRTGNVLWRLQHGEFENQTPKRVILHIGTNNITRTDHYPGDTPDMIAEGILAICRLIHEKSPATRISVMEIFQRGVNPSPYREPIRAVNRLLKNGLAGLEYVELIPISETFMLPDGTDLDATCFYDGCHPTPKGYEIWGRFIRPLLDELR